VGKPIRILFVDARLADADAGHHTADCLFHPFNCLVLKQEDKSSMNKFPSIVFISLAMMLSCRKADPVAVINHSESPIDSVSLVSSSQSKCLNSPLLKSGTIACAQLDSFLTDTGGASILITQYGYCSTSLALSMKDSAGTITLLARDTFPGMAQCGCPFKVSYSLKGSTIENSRIVYIATIQPEVNKPCTLTIRE
jgi:hypothetical protein